MKNLFVLILVTFCIFFMGCEEEATYPQPTADFSKTPTIVIADKTNVQFRNQSSGEIDSYYWNFENGLNSSSSKNPRYQFEFEGARRVTLTAEGPGGSNSRSLDFVVYAFDPNCPNLNNYSTHSTNKINNLRSNNLVRNGYIEIKNDYNVPITVSLYPPENWLSGKYNRTSWFRDLDSGIEGLLRDSNGNPKVFSNEWGISVSGTNGLISCIRTVGAVGIFDGSKYHIKLSNVLDGI